VDGLEPTASPAQHPGQIDIQTQFRDCFLQRVRLLHLIDDSFDLYQRAREPRGKAIREQTERAMTFWAIPARNKSAGRRDPLIGAMAGKRTLPQRMQRTAPQSCQAPALAVSVFLAGEGYCKS